NFPAGRSPLEIILRRERLIIAACLAAIASLAWFYLLRSGAAMPNMAPAVDMAGMPGMPMPSGTVTPAGMIGPQWNAATFLLLFVMWAVMMVAMMLPSAAPMILAFLTV